MLFIKTSLNMFKHYKLKPSFSIITDNKTKDRAGVGDRGTHYGKRGEIQSLELHQ